MGGWGGGGGRGEESIYNFVPIYYKKRVHPIQPIISEGMRLWTTIMF